MVEPLTGMALGGLVGWVTQRLGDKAVAGAKRRLRASAGGPADEHAVNQALIQAVRHAVAAATAEVYGEDTSRAAHAKVSLLEREARPGATLPLADGADLADLPHAVRDWVAETFYPADDDSAREQAAGHELSKPLCLAILKEIEREATRGGGDLYRLWSVFCLRELGVDLAAAKARDDSRWEFWPVDQAGVAFVGRDEALAALDVGDELRMVCSVDGMGGVGKTALAVAYAEKVAARYPDGRVFFDFDSYSCERAKKTAEDALRAVLRGTCLSARDIDGLDAAGLQAAWRRAAEGRRLVMVWDNVAETAQIAPLLVRQAGCLTLVTGRRPLDVDDARSVSLDVMGEAEAAALFARVAGSDRCDDAELTARAVRACMYMPVLVKHHATRLRRKPSLRELVAELEHHAVRDAKDRLYASLALSYEELDVREQHAFRVLGAHPGEHLTVEVAAAAMSCRVEESIKVLEGLDAAGLAQRHATDPPAPEPRLYAYAAHDVIRDYAAHVSRGHADERVAIRRNIVDCYQRRLDEYVDVDFAWFSIEESNIRAASLSGRDGPVARLAFKLGERHGLSGNTAASAVAYGHAATVFEAVGDRTGQSQALMGLAAGARRRGDFAVADDLFGRAARTFEECGDWTRYAQALQGMAAVARRRGGLTVADRLYRQSEEAFLTAGEDVRGRASALQGRAAVARERRLFDEAEDLYRQAREVFEAADDKSGVANTLMGLGATARRRGDLDAATRWYSNAAEAFAEADSQAGRAQALYGMASAEARKPGGKANAAQLFLKSADAFESVGYRVGNAQALAGLAGCVDRATACALLRRALAVFEEIDAPDAERVRRRLRRMGCDRA
ncbi:MAG: tetratricopeptide repeat protein [Stackebrandtia sp.]